MIKRWENFLLETRQLNQGVWQSGEEADLGSKADAPRVVMSRGEAGARVLLPRTAHCLTGSFITFGRLVFK